VDEQTLQSCRVRIEYVASGKSRREKLIVVSLLDNVPDFRLTPETTIAGYPLAGLAQPPRHRLWRPVIGLMLATRSDLPKLTVGQEAVLAPIEPVSDDTGRTKEG
jgi:hypothetical protein